MHHFASKAMQQIKPSELDVIWAKSTELSDQGIDIVNFGIGRPDFDTPRPIKDAAIKAMEQGHVHYTLTRGLPELRQAIADDLKKRINLDLDPQKEIMVTVGCVEAITTCLLTVLNPGDEVLIPEPMYPFYWGWAEYLGAKSVAVPLDRENGYALNEEALREKVTSRTKILIINTPSNPTGACFSESSLKAAAKIAQENDLLVISDEIYDRLVYDGFKHKSIAALEGMKERTVITSSFSKAFAMDGWRVGYLTGPGELLCDMDNAHLRASTCANAMAQWGALEGLRLGDELVEPMRKRYEARRNLIVDMVNHAKGLSCVKPQGAFYLWLEYGDLGMNDMDLALHMLDKAHVAAMPGSAFGPSARNAMRISYATKRSVIEKGMKRLIKAFDELRG